MRWKHRRSAGYRVYGSSFMPCRVRSSYFGAATPTRRGTSESEAAPRTSARLVSRLLVNNAAFHHENYSAYCGNVFKWIAIQRDDVGFVARCDGTDTVAHAHRFGGKRVR